MKQIKTYCPNCGRETIHVIYTEDGYGASGVARIFFKFTFPWNV